MANGKANTLTGGWKTVRLGDVVVNINDYFKQANTSAIRYVAGEHIDEGDLHVRRYGLTSDDLVPPTFNRLFKAGDVLFHSRNIRKLAQPDFDGLTGEKLFVLRTKDASKLIQDFLPLLLQASDFSAYVEERWAGSTNKFLNKTPLMAYEFALPPIEEQIKVLKAYRAASDLVEALRIARDAAVVAYDRMSLDYFAPRKERYRDNDPGSVFAPSWSRPTLEELCVPDAPVCYGIVQVLDDVPDGVPTVAIKDLGGDFGEGLHRTDRSIESSYSRSRVVAGDLLISVKAVVGDVALVPEGFNGNISRDLARARLNNRFARGDFCLHLIRSKAFKRYLSKYVVGSTRDELSIGTLRNLHVPLPTIDEQASIAESLHEAVTSIASLNARLAGAELLAKRMLQELLHVH